MTQTLTPSSQQKPKIVTLVELQSVLAPYVLGNKWAENAIVDLWKLGAPIPVAVGQPEQRVLLPGQFAKWWADLAQQMGYPSTGAQSYNQLSPLLRNSGAGAIPTLRRRQRRLSL